MWSAAQCRGRTALSEKAIWISNSGYPDLGPNFTYTSSVKGCRPLPGLPFAPLALNPPMAQSHSLREAPVGLVPSWQGNQQSLGRVRSQATLPGEVFTVCCAGPRAKHPPKLLIQAEPPLSQAVPGACALGAGAKECLLLWNQNMTQKGARTCQKPGLTVTPGSSAIRRELS